jgi:hypothetical protein
MDVFAALLALYPAMKRYIEGPVRKVVFAFVAGLALALRATEWGPDTPWIVRSRLLALVEQTCRLGHCGDLELESDEGIPMVTFLSSTFLLVVPRLRWVCAFARGWVVDGLAPGSGSTIPTARLRTAVFALQGAVPGGVRVRPGHDSGVLVRRP